MYQKPIASEYENAFEKALFDNAISIDNFILDADSYKLSHAVQYPAGTQYVSSYIEARSGFGPIKNVRFFGAQIELAMLRGVQVTQHAINEARDLLPMYGYEMYVDRWEYILREHGGRLPVRIDAVDEGTIVPVSIPLLRITNTDPQCAWLVSFLETRLLRAVWYPTTVATISNFIVREIGRRLQITDGRPTGLTAELMAYDNLSEDQLDKEVRDALLFKLHDFGARGTTSRETAGRGSVAHLLNSRGTDTISGIIYARNFYGEDVAGYSIPASEHSTMTALGREGELTQMERMLDAFPTGIIACVSDSYDLFKAIREYWGTALKDKILSRQGTLVVRPDSGNPVEIVPDVIEALMAKFGCSMTPNGYRILPPQVRVIQGDGINQYSVVQIMDAMMARGLAIGNIAFGMGGALLQGPMRDDFAFAMKASAIDINGEWHDIYKDPITAKGSKTSKRGVQGAMRNDSGGWVARRAENIPSGYDQLKTVFLDGELTNIQTLSQARAANFGKFV